MSTPSNQVVTLEDAKVLKGQRAWGKIKATAQEQRELWRDIGEALLVGRRLHKSNKLFGQWIKEKGFDDMRQPARTDAMWLAQLYPTMIVGIPVDITHPENIRRWHRENAKVQQLPEELQDLTIESHPSIELDQRSAERIAKVINRAKAGGEGSEIARKHVESIAKKHGVPRGSLENAVAKEAPTSTPAKRIL